MIFDQLQQIGKYRGLSRNLDTAITFLEHTDLETLPLGRTTIEGDEVFINVMYAETKHSESLLFESHKRYMDIQIDLEGVECVEIGKEEGHLTKAYDEVADIGFHEVEKAIPCVLGKGCFVVCMAGERHKPGIAVGKPSQIKKCVVKVGV